MLTIIRPEVPSSPFFVVVGVQPRCLPCVWWRKCKLPLSEVEVSRFTPWLVVSHEFHN
jgi:hypothetical protein